MVVPPRTVMGTSNNVFKWDNLAEFEASTFPGTVKVTGDRVELTRIEKKKLNYKRNYEI